MKIEIPYAFIHTWSHNQTKNWRVTIYRRETLSSTYGTAYAVDVCGSAAVAAAFVGIIQSVNKFEYLGFVCNV